MRNKLGPIIFIDVSIKKNVYIGMLEQNLLGYIDTLAVDGLQDIVFQQDNARSHIANDTQKWLKNAVREHGFSEMVAKF